MSNTLLHILPRLHTCLTRNCLHIPWPRCTTCSYTVIPVDSLTTMCDFGVTRHTMYGFSHSHLLHLTWDHLFYVLPAFLTCRTCDLLYVSSHQCAIYSFPTYPYTYNAVVVLPTCSQMYVWYAHGHYSLPVNSCRYLLIFSDNTLHGSQCACSMTASMYSQLSLHVGQSTCM